MGISSSSADYLTLAIRALEIENFLMDISVSHSVSVSSGRTPILRFSFPRDTETSDTFLLTVRQEERETRSCVIVGISDPTCPWNDDSRTLGNNKITARILSLGYFPVRSDQFTDGFIVILKQTELDSCHSEEALEDILPGQNATLSVSVTQLDRSFTWPVSLAVLSLVLVGLSMMMVLSYWWHTKFHSRRSTEQQEADLNQDSHTIDDTEEAPRQIFLPELIQKYKTDEWHRRSRSDSYMDQVILVSLFYIVPAAQLVFNKSKDNEQCYFNFGCARPWLIFEAFNHVFRDWFKNIFSHSWVTDDSHHIICIF